MVYCNIVESSNTSEISEAWITFDATEMRRINWGLEYHVVIASSVNNFDIIKAYIVIVLVYVLRNLGMVIHEFW